MQVQKLWFKYCSENPDYLVSIGMFINILPFYVRNITATDMEMCCCKLHLHGRWVINAIIRVASKLDIRLPFNSYTSFFSICYNNCDVNENTYIPWQCTPNKKQVCQHVNTNFSNILHQIESLYHSHILINRCNMMLRVRCLEIRTISPSKDW